MGCSKSSMLPTEYMASDLSNILEMTESDRIAMIHTLKKQLDQERERNKILTERLEELETHHRTDSYDGYIYSD